MAIQFQKVELVLYLNSKPTNSFARLPLRKRKGL
jgi:hypothetical protein